MEEKQKEGKERRYTKINEERRKKKRWKKE